MRSPSRWPTSPRQRDAWSEADRVEQAEGTLLRCGRAEHPVFAASTPAVQSFMQSGSQASSAVRVDGLVDALVAERGDQAVGSAGQLDRDRHRAVFRLEAFCHMRGEYRIRVEPGGLRAGPRRVGSGLRGGCGVAGSAAVAVDLGVDRGAVPAETAGDHRVGLTAFDPRADLFAFRRGQGLGWHAGRLHRSGLCVNSGQSRPHHDLTGGGSTPTPGCSRHPLNSPSLFQRRTTSTPS